MPNGEYYQQPMNYQPSAPIDSPMAPSPEMMPMVSPMDEASLVKETRPEKVIDKIEHILKGEEYNEKEETWEKKYDPLINNVGIRSIMIDVKAVVNQNTILSNLRDDEIRNIIISLGDTVIMKLMMRREEFEVDYAELSSIVYLVCNMSYMALKRGYFEGERKFLKTTTQEKIGIMQYPGMQPQRKGFTDRFNIFKRK